MSYNNFILNRQMIKCILSNFLKSQDNLYLLSVPVILFFSFQLKYYWNDIVRLISRSIKTFSKKQKFAETNESVVDNQSVIWNPNGRKYEKKILWNIRESNLINHHSSISTDGETKLHINCSDFEWKIM